MFRDVSMHLIRRYDWSMTHIRSHAHPHTGLRSRRDSAAVQTRPTVCLHSD